MEYLRIDPAIDSDPKLEAAGWWATRVYELLLKVSAQRDLRGRFSPEQQDQVWLARRWDAPSDIDSCRVIREGIEKLLFVKALAKDQDGTLLIVGWERWYPTPKTGAERTAKWRQGVRDESDTRDVTPSHAVTVTPTAPDCTAPDCTAPDCTAPDCTAPHKTDLDLLLTADCPGASDNDAWQAVQQQREEAGLAKEATKPKRWPSFWEAFRSDFAEDSIRRLVRAHAAFLADKAFRAKDWGTDVFMSERVYRRRVPAPEPPPPPPNPPGPRCDVPGCAWEATDKGPDGHRLCMVHGIVSDGVPGATWDGLLTEIAKVPGRVPEARGAP